MTAPLGGPNTDRQHERFPDSAAGEPSLFGDGLQLLAVGILLDFVLFAGTQIDFAARLAAIALLLLAVIKSQGWLLLAAIQLSLLFREPGKFELEFGRSSLIVCSFFLALVMYAHAAQSARTRLSRWFAARLSGGTPAQEGYGRPISGSSRTLRSIARQLVAVVSIVVVAMLLLTRLPITLDGRTKWLVLSIKNEDTLWPGATVLTIGLLLFVILREAAWRQLTPAQARLYLRSQFIREHLRDLRLIVRRKMRERAKSRSAHPPSSRVT